MEEPNHDGSEGASAWRVLGGLLAALAFTAFCGFVGAVACKTSPAENKWGGRYGDINRAADGCARGLGVGGGLSVVVFLLVLRARRGPLDPR